MPAGPIEIRGHENTPKSYVLDINTDIDIDIEGDRIDCSMSHLMNNVHSCNSDEIVIANMHLLMISVFIKTLR